LKIVKIKWWDAMLVSDYPWTDPEVVKSFKDKDMEVVSIGFLVSEDDSKIIICMSNTRGSFGAVFCIPKGCVKKVEYL